MASYRAPDAMASLVRRRTANRRVSVRSLHLAQLLTESLAFHAHGSNFIEAVDRVSVRGQCLSWVKTRKAQSEQMSSAVP
jgi:hypothetical protein